MDNFTAKKIVSERRTMNKVRITCDKNGWPYPPELISYLQEQRALEEKINGN